MTPEAAAFLDKSRECLAKAEDMLAHWPDEAGRAAYLAGFHAAQAFIFQKQERVLKTHSGVRSEFGRLVKDDSRLDIDRRAFLGRTYQLKAIADYETGPGSKVTHQQAAQAIAAAKRFVTTVATLIDADPADNSKPAD